MAKSFHKPHAFCLREGGHHGDEKTIQLGLWGDMPYAKNGDGTKDGEKMLSLIAAMNEAELDFTMYDGDTKDGSSFCDDAAIGADAKSFFNRLQAPAVYVLGDNEWTDCHRINNGGYNALERLDYLRKTLFNTPYSFGKKKIRLEHQGPLGQAYSENIRFAMGAALFVGLNVPGSNNNKVNEGDCLSGKSARTQKDCDEDNAEYADRNAHNLAWIKETFQTAKARRYPGILFVIQADPGFDWPETEGVNERKSLPGIDGYNELLDLLVDECGAYDGEVVLVHGDTHYFKIDKPLLDATHLVKNFTRVQTFGSPNADWIRVTVDRKSPNIFTFEPMMVDTK